MANIDGDVPLWMKAGSLFRCLMPSLDLRKHRGNITEQNTDIRYTYMFEILSVSIATDREAFNQEKQRSAEPPR